LHWQSNHPIVFDRSMKKILVLFLIISVLMGCSKEEATTPNIVGKWRFAGYLVENKLDVFNLTFPAYFVTLQLTDTQNTTATGGYQATGQAPINTYTASYKYDESAGNQGSMKVSDMAATLLPGAKDAVEYETKYLDRLKNAVRFDVSNPKKLYIYISSPQGEVMVYERI
jgi:hypothetical protein